jgi:hypothetical protein
MAVKKKFRLNCSLAIFITDGVPVSPEEKRASTVQMRLESMREFCELTRACMIRNGKQAKKLLTKC